MVVDHKTDLPLNDVLVAVLMDKETYIFGAYSKERWDEYYTFTQDNGVFELPPLKRLGSVSRTYMGTANAPAPQIVALKDGYKLKRLYLKSNWEGIQITLHPLAEGKRNPHGEAARLINRLVAHEDGKTCSKEDERALRRMHAELTDQ